MEAGKNHTRESVESASIHPGGIRAISRWLSGATPPEWNRIHESHPAGMTEDCRLRHRIFYIPSITDREVLKQRSAELSEARWHPCRGKASKGRSTSEILVSSLRLGAASLFVPPGTPDNSPPLQRWDLLSSSHSPGRGDRPLPHGIAPPVTSPPISQASAVPRGTRRLVRIAFPPLKRWAIVGCPWRDKTRSFRWKNSHRKPYPCRDAGLDGASSSGGAAAINRWLMAVTPAGVGASRALFKKMPPGDCICSL